MEETTDIEIVDRFSYTVDFFSSEGRIQEAVTSRIKLTWKKFRGILNFVLKGNLPVF